MIFQSLLSIIIPLALGFALVCILWPGTRPVRSSLLLKLSLSVGPGFGLFSCLYFLQLSLFGPSRKRLAAGALALFIVLLAGLSYRVLRLKGSPAGEPRPEPMPKSKLHKAILIVFFIALVSAVLTFIFMSLKRPHGEWDAWAVFNMKARFLFRAGEHWRDLFTEPFEWAGPDYPLLWSAAIAGCWTLIGAETLIIPGAAAMLFTLATVGVVVYSVALLRGRTQGLLAGLVLLCTPYFITHGADQYSDIPIGYFYLCTLAALALRDELWEDDNRLLILAGVMAGLTAWTKNEGILFIILVTAARFAVTFRKQAIKPYLRQMSYFLAGLIPILLVIFYFKTTVVIAQNGYLSPLKESSVASKLMDFSRYRIIADYLIKIGLGFGSWTVSVVPLLGFYLLLLGAKVEEKQKRNILAGVITLSFMMVGFLMIYVISNRDLTWLIVTSLERLLSQLWPSFIFMFFLVVKSPEQAFMKKEDSIPATV
jgi:4-amino-4-deoxy-L-arabinose transferase-like glycosyltransferase